MRRRGTSSTPCRGARRSIIASSRWTPRCAQFVGPALTCQTGADDNLAILAALVLAEPGDVIVAAADGFSATAVVGDNVTMMAKNKGVVAIVIDGMARDSYGIVPVGLPVFSRGITPNSCVRSGPGKVGLPIVCGGVAVQPGDVVLGDRDGVVVIPQARARGRRRRTSTRSAAWRRRRRQRSAPA